MKLFYSTKYEIDIAPHVFPTVKYKLIHDRLIKEGIASEEDFIDPRMARDEDILLGRTPDYVGKTALKNYG
jgi:acetoin utilization deacetylase AcuC-like enzyme